MCRRTDESSNIILICLYVDDIIFMGSSLLMVEELKENMMRTFEMTDLGMLHYFLGFEVRQQPGSIFVCYKRYAEGLIKKFGMLNSKIHVTPLNPNEKLQLEDSSGKADERRFHSMVGSLLYLTHTHPDLMFTMGLLSKFVYCSSKHHLRAMKRVLHCVSGTINMGIKFDYVETFHLRGYVDSDWGGSIDDQRSTTGWVFNLGSSAVAWCSK